MTKNWRKKFKLRKFFLFFWSKIAIYLSLGLYKGRSSYRSQPSKANIQQFKTWYFFTFFFFCGSLLPSGSRIQQLKLMRIHADPDPQPWILLPTLFLAKSRIWGKRAFYVWRWGWVKIWYKKWSFGEFLIWIRIHDSDPDSTNINQYQAGSENFVSIRNTATVGVFGGKIEGK